MDSLPVPVDVLKQHSIILGKTGAGKSSVARLLAEFILQPTLDTTLPTNLTIVDPKGDWWGLRIGVGRERGFPVVIFGGEHADIQITSLSGAAVAEVINNNSFTTLVDTSSLMMGERVRFMTDFATTYYRGGKQQRFLLLDEVHHFCPKGKIPDPQVGKMLHIANTIAAEGRGKGITMIAASQRPQKVHNDFLTSCETLIAMRVLHPADRAAVKDWMEGAGNAAATREILTGIAGLKRGSGWVWSPEINFGPQIVHFPKFKTFDSFAPQGSVRQVHLSPVMRPDIDAIKAHLGETLKTLQENDPAVLRARIRELESSAGKNRPVEQQISEDVAKNAWDRGFDAGAKKAHKEDEAHLQALVGLILQAIDRHSDMKLPPTFITPMSDKITGSKPPAPVPAAKVQRQEDVSRVGYSKGQLKILDAILWLETAGIQQPSRQQVSAIAKYRGGAFTTAMGQLKTSGLVMIPGENQVQMTNDGRALAKPDTSDIGMIDRWREALRTEGQRKIFGALVSYGGRPVSRAELSERIAYRGGAFTTAMGELRTMGAVIIPSEGMVALSEYVRG